MGKKNENKELNAILAQLKKSYSGNDNIDNSASDESEDDFQRMLSNYFSDGDTDKDVYKFTASESPDPENITAESDYSLADFADFSVEEEPEEVIIENELAIEEEPIIEKMVEDEPAIEEMVEEELAIEEIVEEEPAIEEMIEDEPVIEEIIEDEPVIEEIIEDELDDKAIVDDVFAVMFPQSSQMKTAYEELGLEDVATVEPKSSHNEHISRMFDLDIEEEDVDESDIVNMPAENDPYSFDADDVVIVESELGDESDIVPVVPEEDDFNIQPALTVPSFEKVNPKETIDDIIGQMNLDNDEIVLDISAILPDVEEEIALEVDKAEAEDDSVYMSDPLQGHLSDAAFVPYKIADDSVNFDVDAEAPELDDEEISLLLDFGYDDEAEAEVGRERTNEIKRRNDEALTNDGKIYGYCGEEYSNNLQIPQIKDKYIKDRKELLIKSAVTLSLSLVLFFMAIVNCFAVSVNFLVYSIIELVILATVSVIGFDGFKKGVIGLFKLEPNFNTVPAVVMACTLVYNIFSILYICITSGTYFGGILLPCGFFAATYVFAMIFSEYIECMAEANTFEVISSAADIYTAEKLNKTKDEPTPIEKQFGKLSEDFSENHTFRIRKTSVPSAYFLKTSRKQNRLGGSFYLLGGAFVVALIIGCIALIKEGSLASAAYSSIVIILMSMPMSFSLVKALPKLSSVLALKEKNCAIVGDKSDNEYLSADTLIFDDECAIEIVKKIEIRPQTDSDIASAMKITARALRALGGPVSKIVSSKFSQEDEETVISVSCLRDNGIEFYMDSSIYMLIGDAAFMSTYGIRVSSDRDVHTSSSVNKNGNVIYIAIDGVPRLGYIIHSKISDEFAALASELHKNGIKVAVESYDPTVNDYYFEQNKINGVSAITSYKPERFYDRRADSIADGGIFALDDAKNIIHPLLEARKLNHTKRINKIINFTSSIVGCIASVIFVIFALLEKAGMNLNFITLTVIFLLQSISVLSVVLNSFDIKRKRAKQ